MTPVEKQMYGCTEEYLKACATTATNFNMFIAGKLSDVQELMGMGNFEKANKVTNQVKFLIFTFTDTRNETVLVNYDEVSV
jgi:hypothetical protein